MGINLNIIELEKWCVDNYSYKNPTEENTIEKEYYKKNLM